MIKCTSFRQLEKNTLRGFVDLELTRVGLVIKDCTWHVKADKEWIGMPARSFEDAAGVRHWQPVVEFAQEARAARTAFQREAIAAVREAVAGTSPAAAAPTGEGGQYIRTVPPRRPDPRPRSGFVDDPLDDLLPMESDR